MEKVKVHLGCRTNLLSGYINVDKENFPINYSEHKFLQADASRIDEHFIAETVDEILSRFFFEHFSNDEVSELLFRLWYILKPEGKLITEVPDFLRILKRHDRMHSKGDFEQLNILNPHMFGTVEETVHKSTWSEKIGRYYLTRENLFTIDKIVKGKNTITFHSTKIGKIYGEE